MREAETYRGARRNAMRETGEPMERFETFKRVSKRQWFFKNHPDIAKWFLVARGLLMTGPNSTPPTWRAIVKTMEQLAKSPLIRNTPIYATVPQHIRGSWRSK